ncbi:MAG: UDP-N-acetylmuramoyl-L-alanine--D-glutamate ligase [Candidatus Limnocylindrus sp.]
MSSEGLSLHDLEAPAIAAGSLRGRNIIILGGGRTGQATAAFAAAAGANVTVHDTDTIERVVGAAEAFADGSIRTSFGDAENLAPHLATADLVVHSPAVTLGFPTVRPAIERDLRAFAAGAIPLVGEGAARGRILISEPEWALRLLGDRWRVGVTGTKGKSTTSNLIATILARVPSHPVELGGNNGKPLIGRAASLPADTRVVIELSELQLPSLHSTVDVGVFTNVTVDHLDRHGSVSAYRSVKRLLADRIADDGVLVVNLDDPVVASYAGIGRVETVGYRLSSPVPGGVGIVDGWIVSAGVLRAPRYGGGAAATGPGGRILPVGEIAIPGEHSVSNVLAAVSVALIAGVAPDAIRSAVSSFTGIPHRLETVAVINGIRYVNDSQATQPDAVAAAVRSFPKPLVLIAGGRSKGLDLRDLAPVVAERCTAAVVMGELADELEELFRGAGLTQIERATSVESAVEVGTSLADKIGAASADGIRATVLLSPIGSSFDMYNNPFGARGEAFRAAVLAQVEVTR